MNQKKIQTKMGRYRWVVDGDPSGTVLGTAGEGGDFNGCYRRWAMKILGKLETSGYARYSLVGG
jgi:hypothetical protein